MTTGNFVPGGRSIVQLKDIDNILKAAQELDLTLPLTQMQRERFYRLCHELGGAELDHSALYLELLDRNNISV